MNCGNVYIYECLIFKMRIEVNISKKHMFAFIFILVAFAGLFFVYAYGTANPPVFGHTPSETGAGTDLSFGGSSTFGLGPNGEGEYFFPKLLGIAGRDPNFRSLFVANYTGNGVASIGISGGNATGGFETIDFIHRGMLKASIQWASSTNALEINGVGGDTVINRNGGSVGIGKAPSPSYEFDVNGKTKLDQLCMTSPYGVVCRSDWENPSSPSSDAVMSIIFASGDGQGSTKTVRLAGNAPGPVAIVNPPYASFCALSKVYMDGSTGQYCDIKVVGTDWILEANRQNVNSGMQCKAVCLFN